MSSMDLLNAANQMVQDKMSEISKPITDKIVQYTAKFLSEQRLAVVVLKAGFADNGQRNCLLMRLLGTTLNNSHYDLLDLKDRFVVASVLSNIVNGGQIEPNLEDSVKAIKKYINKDSISAENVEFCYSCLESWLMSRKLKFFKRSMEHGMETKKAWFSFDIDSEGTTTMEVKDVGKFVLQRNPTWVD